MAKKKLIKFDTSNENSHKYKNNLELFNLIIPNIVSIIDDEDTVYSREEIDIERITKGMVESNDLHCVWLNSGYYISIGEIEYLIIEINEKDERDLYWANTLSEFCEELADKYKIDSWKPLR